MMDPGMGPGHQRDEAMSGSLEMLAPSPVFWRGRKAGN